VTDEFVEPHVVIPAGADECDDRLRDGDVVLCANFRPDRMRQLVHALVDGDDFDGFDRGARPDLRVVTLTEYEAGLPVEVVFAPHVLDHTLADVREEAGVGQLHVAETEKYAHVTYFFNGGLERVHDGEDRELAPSPRDVPTYDLKPQMAAERVGDLFVEGFASPDVAFAVVNFANPDMVGHTGSIPAAIAACEATDAQLARVLDAIAARGGVALVTADHGNAEYMLTPEGKPHTAHTTTPVPFVVVETHDAAHTEPLHLRDGGRLGDVAPTVLALLGLPQPASMTGTSLLAAVAVAG
jgi:2,3-bisphosphoglycerate-independent phosphoglycerate mutase